MRILRVAQTLYPEVKGGGAYHSHAMSRDQAAMGHDVTVLTVAADDQSRREKRDGYTVVRRQPTASVIGNDLSVGVARFLRRAGEFDVVHAHSHLYFSTNLAAIQRQFCDTPMALTNHGLYSQTAPEWIFDAYLRTLGRWTFNRTDLVFCYTEEDKRRLREIGVTAAINVVPNGIDTSQFTPDGPTSDWIDHDGPVVLFVGRLVEGKRPREAIDAVERLPDETNAKLYVVGNGPQLTSLQEHADPGRVEFLGHLPYDAMPSVYRAADVLILPSRAEGFPRTVLEAFASGTPVVSSHLSQTESVVRQGGETVDVGNVDGYADAIQRVLEDRHSLAEAGREVVVDEFQWQETVEQTTAALGSLR